jgi:hypothetical protein
MMFRANARAAASGCRAIVGALALAVSTGIAYPAPLAAQPTPEAGVAPNIIVTTDSPSVIQQGGFQRLTTRMSRSRTPLVASGAGAHNITFYTSIAQHGYYRVFVWWPQVYGNVGAVDVTVRHQRGTATVTMDQQARNGQWVPVAIYEFGASGAYVTLSGRPGATVVADAVRFEYMGTQMPALALETDALPIAATGEPYVTSLDVLAGTPPYTFNAQARDLPPGLALDGASGTLAGTPASVGSYTFDIEVFDQSSQRAVRTYTVDVVRGSPGTTKALATTKAAPADLRKDGTPNGTPPDLSGLVNQIAAMPEGEWMRANVNNFSDVWSPADLRPLVGSTNPGPYKLIEAWSSYAWDPNRGDLWLFGGGHANYSGNDVYRWRASTQRWERASLPSEIEHDDLGNWQAVDGWDAAPASAHTYDNNMFFPHIDRLVVFGGAAYNSGNYFKREVTPTTGRATGPFFFDPTRADPNKVGGTTGSHVMRVAPHPEVVGGNMWTNRDMYVNVPGGFNALLQVNGCTAYADEGGVDVAYIAAAQGGSTNLNLYRYAVPSIANPAQDTLKQVGAFYNGTSGLTACGYDSVRKVLARIGTTSVPFVYWSLASPGTNNRDVRVTPTDPSGEFPTLLSSGQLKLPICGFDFDSTRSRFVLWCGDGRVWTLTPPATIGPTGWTIVKQPAPTQATPNGDYGTGLLGKWKYIPNLDAFIGLQDKNLGNIWIYKPVGWVNPQGGTTINPPTGVSASDGTSTSKVTITWNAASGASSYTVYRSTTSGTQGASIGSTTSTTFTDTTPVPGTTYFYGVTASGGAGTSALSAQDGGYAAAVIGGGTLSGSASVPFVVDLTAAGTTDWAHWLPFNRKSGAGFISNYTAVGTANVTTYTNDPRSFVWSNGTPTASGNDAGGATASGAGAGFTFTVTADTTTRTLLVYIGGAGTTGRLTAHLSDASAADYVDTSLGGTGRYDGVYTLVFHAASAGQQLRVTWTQASGSGSVSLQAAALQ